MHHTERHDDLCRIHSRLVQDALALRRLHRHVRVALPHSHSRRSRNDAAHRSRSEHDTVPASMMFLRRILLPVAVVIATGAQAQSPKPAQSRDTTYRLPVVVTEGVRPIATSDGGSALDIRLDSLPFPSASKRDRALRDVPFMQI